MPHQGWHAGTATLAPAAAHRAAPPRHHARAPAPRFAFTVTCPGGITYTSPDPVTITDADDDATASQASVPLTFGPGASGPGTFDTSTISSAVNCTVGLRVDYDISETYEDYYGDFFATAPATELAVT